MPDAVEEMKRLVALIEPLIERVAKDTGLSPETVFKVLRGLGDVIKLSAGQAAAAVLLDKPAEQVTEAEARLAISGLGGRRDDDRFQRARRAALYETVFSLAPVVVPDSLAGMTMTGIKLLDESDDHPGMFTPPKRGRGRRGRSVNGSDKHLMIEVLYMERLKHVARDEAVTLVTGVERPETASAGARPEPTMTRKGDHSALRRIVDELEKVLPKVADDARKAAEAHLRGEPDAHFEAFRRDYLATERSRGGG